MLVNKNDYAAAKGINADETPEGALRYGHDVRRRRQGAAGTFELLN